MTMINSNAREERPLSVKTHISRKTIGPAMVVLAAVFGMKSGICVWMQVHQWCYELIEMSTVSKWLNISFILNLIPAAMFSSPTLVCYTQRIMFTNTMKVISNYCFQVE